MIAPTVVHAENVLALAGITDPSNDPTNTYGWQLEFQDPLSTRMSASFSWLNEGHVPGHHRDGAAPQLWYTAPKWWGRVQFGIGVGPYVYFDTEQEISARGYSNVHSIGGLLSASVDIDVTRSWFLSLAFNGVYAPGDLNSLGFMLGGGYHFGRADRAENAMPSDAEAVDSYARQQIQLFAGQMIYNELDSHSTRAIGLEYRLALVPWAAWSATWFYNPGDANSQRNQIATQLWLVDSLAKGKLALSVGLGVYAPLGTAPSTAQTYPATLSGLSALRVECNLSRRSSLVLSWYRSFTNDDSDRDIITLGYGFRFGAGD